MRQLLLTVVIWILASLGAHAAPGNMLFIAPANQDMPVAGYRNDVLVDGIIKDLGEAIAQRLGLQAIFVSVPSKRVPILLAQGQADALCYVMPQWIDGNFNWSRPLVATGEVIVASETADKLASLHDLANRPVGTVLGYRHPQLDKSLGTAFIRDDAPTMERVFAKLAIGRTQYAVVDQLTLAFKRKSDTALRLRSEMELSTSVTRCAFSRRSSIPFAGVEQAIESLVSDGSVDRMLAKYR